ncbi:PREDICTED: uncharacterized protein LOC109358003 [Lupinus angustifolius]|uniref:uncharacterized protein LOC109358003 n=1 Tax=Lupinus angustifolius TaxID=3871 RepID=UPI00092E64CD|nr:PREDICTED: uncharacterized protein LOC109358003 [Lupinus angustifolius]
MLEPNSTTLNPAFTHWVRQDQLLLHGIVSSVVAIVVTHLATVQTAQRAWDTLKTMYASRSRVHIMALKQRITTFTKGTQTMATYLQGIKAIADELAIIDHPLDNTDLVIHTLNGLSSEYKDISAALCSRETSVSYADLHEILMDFFLFRENYNTSDTLVATANTVQRHRSQQRSKTQLSGRNFVSNTSDNQVVCQYCEKPGHIAKKCYKINGYPKRNGSHPSVNMAQYSSPVQHSSWVMDTRASHHVTQDFNN